MKDNNPSGIYKITCAKNNKIYIGSAIDLKDRKHTHFKQLRTNKHYNNHLQRAYNKYGSNSFSFSVLEYVTDETKLISREQYWMDKLKPEFNICKIAGSPLGRKATPETRMKMSNAHKGNVLSDEHKKKIGDAHRNKPNSLTHMRNISEGKKGKIQSWWIGVKHSKETIDKMKGRGNLNYIERWIDVYTKDGILIHCFRNTREAREVLGAERGAMIHDCCRKNKGQIASGTRTDNRGKIFKFYGYSYQGYIYKYSEELE